MKKTTLFTLIFILAVNGEVILCDAPAPWSLYFQDFCSPYGEGLFELFNHLLFYLILIGISAIYMLFITLYKDKDSKKKGITQKYWNHGSVIEIVWTVTPAFALIAVAFPSFKLLYLMDEIINPAMTIKAIGNQWYWSYEYSDFLNNDGEVIAFDSYTKPEEDLEEGELRLLDVDQRLIVPVDTNIRLIITSNDVIHAFALPSAGIKLDCYPGRLNQSSMLIEREGLFYGQCSELCGINHNNMSIVVEATSLKNFLTFLQSQI